MTNAHAVDLRLFAIRQTAEYALWAEIALREHDAPGATIARVADLREAIANAVPGDPPGLADEVWSEIDCIVSAHAGGKVAQRVAELARKYAEFDARDKYPSGRQKQGQHALVGAERHIAAETTSNALSEL